MTRSALPPDVVVFDHGVLGRTQPRGTTLLVDGTPVGDPLPGRVDAVVRASPATLDVIVAETRGEIGRVAWLRPGGQQTAVMPGPASARLGTPTVVDARRFLFVRSHAGDNALWEATVAVGDRFRLRRIRALGHGDAGGIRLAIAHYRRAVVAARADGEAHGLEWISLADGRRAHLIDLDGPPRIVVAARHEAQAAWIAVDGAVWVGGMQGSTRKIGSTTGSTLAISHDGRRVCWSEDDVITLADLDAGQTVGHEVDDHVAWLSVA